MRHGKKVAKLGRTRPHRKAMLANMVTSLFENEIVRTTDARAKELRRTAEHLITFAKRNDLHARRQALRVIADKEVVAKLFEELADRYKSERWIHPGREGGSPPGRWCVDEYHRTGRPSRGRNRGRKTGAETGN